MYRLSIGKHTQSQRIHCQSIGSCFNVVRHSIGSTWANFGQKMVAASLKSWYLRVLLAVAHEARREPLHLRLQRRGVHHRVALAAAPQLLHHARERCTVHHTAF